MVSLLVAVIETGWSSPFSGNLQLQKQ